MAMIPVLDVLKDDGVKYIYSQTHFYANPFLRDFFTRKIQNNAIFFTRFKSLDGYGQNPTFEVQH